MTEGSASSRQQASCLIVGCGYVGQRLAVREALHRHVTGMLRSPAGRASLRAAGVRVLRCDLDAPEAGAAEELLQAATDGAVIYLAPPPERGVTDPRVDTFLRLLGGARPDVLLYVSTTGVYGDKGGEPVDESTPVAPANDRSLRRVAAEASVTGWCAVRDVRCVVLRVPGIYGPHRLPLDRLRRGDPAIRPEEAGPGNRIHLDDLVDCILAAVDRVDASGVYNVADGDPSSTTEYLQQVAAATGLPPPELVSKAEAVGRIPPGMLAFLLESRRVESRRMRDELGVRPRYPTAREGIRASLEDMDQEAATT